MDEVDRLAQAEMRSRLSWRIAKKMENISTLKTLLSDELVELDKMQAELNRLSKVDILHEEDLDVRVFVNLNSHYSFFCRTRNQKWKSTN
jgi:hypothetical protein